MRTALAMLRELVSFCPADCLDWSSIDLHEQMVVRDDLVFCPAVYCYATYAESDQRRPLRFHDLPGPCGHRGSTIGGTGLGVSAYRRHTEAARAYARFAASTAAQFAFARHHGQPALRAVWEDANVNARYGNCYRAVRATMDGCWTRPRYKGYLAFQARAGELVESHLRGVVSEADLLESMERLGGEQR
jgi:multiple sugar transport system substrate-binding protein